MREAVIIDAHYICWRAYYATPNLMHDGAVTGVLFGVFREIQSIYDRFSTSQVIFCFEGKTSKRKEIYPDYKKSREVNRSKLASTAKAYREVRRQIGLLRDEILPDELGFKNIFSQDGYEADDVIAAIVKDPGDTNYVIVSGDSDLYQLINKQVIIYNPRSNVTRTRSSFRNEYGISPEEWPMVKAIAGDTSDDIKGVQGVGEKTALKFLRGQLEPKHKAYKQIENSQDLIDFNLKLIQLPFPDCRRPLLKVQDPIEDYNWKEVMGKYGMDSLTKGFGLRTGNL